MKDCEFECRIMSLLFVLFGHLGPSGFPRKMKATNNNAAKHVEKSVADRDPGGRYPICTLEGKFVWISEKSSVIALSFPTNCFSMQGIKTEIETFCSSDNFI